jgi:hypothetical protein
MPGREHDDLARCSTDLRRGEGGQAERKGSPRSLAEDLVRC